MTDPAIEVLRRDDVATHHHVETQSVTFRISLPANISATNRSQERTRSLAPFWEADVVGGAVVEVRLPPPTFRMVPWPRSSPRSTLFGGRSPRFTASTGRDAQFAAHTAPPLLRAEPAWRYRRPSAVRAGSHGRSVSHPAPRVELDGSVPSPLLGKAFTFSARLRFWALTRRSAPPWANCTAPEWLMVAVERRRYARQRPSRPPDPRRCPSHHRRRRRSPPRRSPH